MKLSENFEFLQQSMNKIETSILIFQTWVSQLVGVTKTPWHDAELKVTFQGSPKTVENSRDTTKLFPRKNLNMIEHRNNSKKA